MEELIARISILRYLAREIRGAIYSVLGYVKGHVSRRRGVLVYIGLHRGSSFDLMFRGYESCYGFEANPALFKVLQKKYEKYPNVHLFNVAVADYDGEIDFNISNDDGASSIGHFDERWENHSSGKVRIERTIRVASINLLHFLERQGVDHIDDYVSDIQGMDLQVLKTLKPLIQSKRIGSITCEVAKDEKRNVYADLPDNNEIGFHRLLDENYELVARGWGLLRDGRFDQVPEHWWEMDCRWRLRK